MSKYKIEECNGSYALTAEDGGIFIIFSNYKDAKKIMRRCEEADRIAAERGIIEEEEEEEEIAICHI